MSPAGGTETKAKLTKVKTAVSNVCKDMFSKEGNCDVIREKITGFVRV